MPTEVELEDLSKGSIHSDDAANEDKDKEFGESDDESPEEDLEEDLDPEEENGFELQVEGGGADRDKQGYRP